MLHAESAKVQNSVETQVYYVQLSWNASSSQNVVSYKVYRGIHSGGPYTASKNVGDRLEVNDTTVKNGKSYCYVTTAIDNEGQESGYSNEACASIP